MKEADRERLAIFNIIGVISEFQKDLESITYLACSLCHSKILSTVKMAGGFECKKCRKVVQTKI